MYPIQKFVGWNFNLYFVCSSFGFFANCILKRFVQFFKIQMDLQIIEGTSYMYLSTFGSSPV